MINFKDYFMRVFYSIGRLVHTYPTVSDYASEDTPTGYKL